jgi:hypothetical protein
MKGLLERSSSCPNCETPICVRFRAAPEAIESATREGRPSAGLSVAPGQDSVRKSNSSRHEAGRRRIRTSRR